MKTQRVATEERGSGEWERHAPCRSCSPSKPLLIIRARPSNGAHT